MKRFLAYILLCVSILLSTFVGFVPTVFSINGSADYDSGQNFIYQISLKENGSKNEGNITDGSAIDYVTNIFKERLDAANISTYKLENEGNDTIRLSFKDKSEINTYVSEYLSFDGNIQAMDYSGKIILEQSEFLTQGAAYIDYSNNTPVIVLPLADPEGFKTKLYENINGTKKDNQQTTSSVKLNSIYETMEDDSSSDDTEETKNENYLYIVNNWKTETYSMETIITDVNSADTDELNSYIDRIDATKPEEFYFDYDSTNKNGTFTKIKYSGFIKDANNDMTMANRLARITVSKFNASALDYKVTLINKDSINETSNNNAPFIENLIYHGEQYGQYRSIVMSTLLISTLIALVITSLFLVLNYGIGGICSIVLTPAIMLLTLTTFNSFGAEFNIGTIIALISISIVSLFSGCSYFRSIKNNLYKGKNLRKSNQDTSKNTAFVQIDLSVILLILGLVAYLIPNSIMLSIGATLILGGLYNLLLNGILLRVLYYFLTNSNFIEKHLNLLIIESKKIPDLSKDEKPVYFDQFKKTQNNKKSKTFGFIGLALLFASIIGITTFQLVNGNIYNTQNDSISASRIYLEFDYNENSSIKNVSDLEKKILNNLYTYNTEKDSRSDNKVSYSNILNFTYSYKENYATNKEILKKVYYIIELKNVLDDNSKFSAYVDDSHKLENVSVEDALQYLIVDYNNVSYFNNVELKSVKNVNSDTNNYYCLIFGLVGTALVGVYMMFRFGISRGITSFLFVASGMTITTGIFSLIRGNFTSQITLGIVILAVVGYAILENYFNTEKVLRKEQHLDHNNVDELKDNSRFALNVAYSNIIIMVILSVFVITSFLFAKTFSTYFILFAILGSLLMLLFYKQITVNFVYALSGVFNSIGKRISAKYNSHRQKVNDKKHKKDDGDGPQEAIFIGIND